MVKDKSQQDSEAVTLDSIPDPLDFLVILSVGHFQKSNRIIQILTV